MEYSTNNVTVATKKRLLELLERSIPDDAVVIIPASALNGQMSGKSTTGHKHEPMWNMRFWLASDILVEPRSIASIRSSSFLPLMWLTADKAKNLINKHGFDLIKVECRPEDKLL